MFFFVNFLLTNTFLFSNRNFFFYNNVELKKLKKYYFFIIRQVSFLHKKKFSFSFVEFPVS